MRTAQLLKSLHADRQSDDQGLVDTASAAGPDRRVGARHQVGIGHIDLACGADTPKDVLLGTGSRGAVGARLPVEYLAVDDPAIVHIAQGCAPTLIAVHCAGTLLRVCAVR